MRYTELISLKLTEKQLIGLEELAERGQESRSALIRLAVDALLDEGRELTPWQKMKRIQREGVRAGTRKGRK